MTIKKLTVAAAIAVGIATCSFNNAMAACPLSGCDNGQKMVTPLNACPTCGHDKSTCGCPKNQCKRESAPASTTGLTTSCKDLNMKQVYAYPNAIYGTNNYTGEQSNAIYSTETAWSLDSNDALGLSNAGISVASLGQITGAASGIGTASPYLYGSGALVSRNTTCGSRRNNLPIITGEACGLRGINSGAIVNRNSCADSCPVTIETQSSIDALRQSFVPFQTSNTMAAISGESSGAAAPLVNVFPDVPDNYWAACPIDKLAMNDVVVGYPDRTFKPSKDVSRAEFATMMVKGSNLHCNGLQAKNLFKDVPKSNWANPLIAKAVEKGIMCGYPNNEFKPQKSVTRAEALTAMSHDINCDISCEKAKQILSQYCDGNQVPTWAQIPVAKALDSGVLKTSLNPKAINPSKDASRAEIADMLQNTRIAMGYDTNATTAYDNCPKQVEACAPKKALMINEKMVKIPTLKLAFKDEINAKSSNVGDQFAATTTEEVIVNGKTYPCGSRVNGKIIGVVRPSGCEKGALKLAFTNIENCDGCKADLPKQILTAKISCAKTQNIVARLISTPFTMLGSLIGTTGRTVGGAIASLGNATEAVSNGVGIASGEILQGQFRASGRSLQDAGKAAIIAPIDVTRTALAGTIGLFQSSADEVAYLVDPNGTKISAINPKENVTIAFGGSGE